MDDVVGPLYLFTQIRVTTGGKQRLTRTAIEIDPDNFTEALSLSLAVHAETLVKMWFSRLFNGVAKDVETECVFTLSDAGPPGVPQGRMSITEEFGRCVHVFDVSVEELLKGKAVLKDE